MPKLLQHTHQNIDLFYTDEIKEERQLYSEMEKEIACWTIVKHFIEDNPKYNEIVKNYSKEKNLEKIAILSAHGENIKDSWYYFNEDSGSPIQKWINKMDGKYNALILDVCNPGYNEILSEKSIVLHPEGEISNITLARGEVPIRLFLPNSGYI